MVLCSKNRTHHFDTPGQEILEGTVILITFAALKPSIVWIDRL